MEQKNVYLPALGFKSKVLSRYFIETETGNENGSCPPTGG
jgi:hypothetical protein